MCICCICYSLQSTPNQSQQQALINKSNDDLRRKRPETTRPNHILLFTIINPFYPITVVSTLTNLFIYIFSTIFFLEFSFWYFPLYFLSLLLLFTNRTIYSLYHCVNITEWEGEYPTMGRYGSYRCNYNIILICYFLMRFVAR